MKILKIKIGRTVGGGKTSYTYPPQYKAEKIQVMCYESSLPENHAAVVARGNSDEYLLGVVKDVDAAEFLASPDIQEINEAQALELGNTWTRQIDKIKDQNKVLLILSKLARNEVLTQQDRNELDPNIPGGAIIKSRSFQDALNEYRTKL